MDQFIVYLLTLLAEQAPLTAADVLHHQIVAGLVFSLLSVIAVLPCIWYGGYVARSGYPVVGTGIRVAGGVVCILAFCFWYATVLQAVLTPRAALLNYVL